MVRLARSRERRRLCSALASVRGTSKLERVRADSKLTWMNNLGLGMALGSGLARFIAGVNLAHLAAF